MSDSKSSIADTAANKSIVMNELDRIDRRVDSLWDASHQTKYKLDTLTPILSLLVGGFIAILAASAFYAQKTNERLQRLEKIVGMDEIGRRK